VGKPTDEPANRHLAFQARQIDADAQMRAGCERKMPVRLTRDIQPVGRIELFGVAVGRADAKIQLAAGGQLNAAQSAEKEISTMQRYLEIRAPFDGIISARRIAARND